MVNKPTLPDDWSKASMPPARPILNPIDISVNSNSHATDAAVANIELRNALQRLRIMSDDLARMNDLRNRGHLDEQGQQMQILSQQINAVMEHEFPSQVEAVKAFEALLRSNNQLLNDLWVKHPKHYQTLARVLDDLITTQAPAASPRATKAAALQPSAVANPILSNQAAPFTAHAFAQECKELRLIVNSVDATVIDGITQETYRNNNVAIVAFRAACESTHPGIRAIAKRYGLEGTVAQLQMEKAGPATML